MYAAAVVGLETEAFLEKIRENIGLQNIGLLVLDSPNGSMKRDAWTDSFGDIIFALDFPESFTPPTDTTPTRPGAVVRIPDPNLRAAIAEALGKSPNALITVEEMERLRNLDVQNNRDIRDLTGLQFATNLRELILGHWGGKGNQVSDLSPIAGLTGLRLLFLHNNPISDISLLRGLNLTRLVLNGTLVSDLSPVRSLTNLTELVLDDTLVTDLSPVAGLINLEWIAFSDGEGKISDISPLAGLINLRRINTWGNPISDLSPLAGLTKLERVDICGGDLSDLTPLTKLPNLKELYLAGNGISDISALAGLTVLTRLDLHRNDISDISPIAGLTNLTWLNLRYNEVPDVSPLARLTTLTWLNLEDTNLSDISPLAGLTNLTWLDVSHNQISNFSPLEGLRENITLNWQSNPGFPKGGPKIEGPWLWVVLPGTVGDHLNNTDLLSEVSGGVVTEVEVATHGATGGGSVGSSVWTSHRLPPAGENNIEDMLKNVIRDGTVYGSVSLYSPREQNTTMYVGGDRGVRVWLNGALIYERLNRMSGVDYSDFFPVTLRQGRNVLLVAVHTLGNGFFGFEPGTEYTVTNPGVSYTFSQTPIHTGDTFTLDILAEDVFDMAGWQFDIAFDPAALEAVSVSEGDFLKQNGASTFFQGGSIDNAAGKITGLNAARLSAQGAQGSGCTSASELQGEICRRNEIDAAELPIRLCHRP